MRLISPEADVPRAPSRRMVVAGSLFTAGYALAVGEARAQAITTPREGLVTADVQFAGHQGYPLPAYLARPAGAGPWPAVIVVNEIFGIHAYIKDVCHRFAREGYVALAPDYFDRAGDPATLTDWEQIRAIVGTATHPQVMGDTDGALAWLAAQHFATARRAVTGFCWGGAVTWMACAHSPAFHAGVAWYGRLTRPTSGFYAGQERPWPADVAGDLHCPVLGLYAENDQGIPLETVEEMRGALDAAGNPAHAQIIVYPGTEHGFHADYRPSYNEAAARDGWMRALRWFRQHGV
ncbi:MAG: hypothetical protein GC206_17170 [Alphaproteobacteria bacterium]|nr:hypothetical protein [Alphaproteobacteria bacterium]